MSEAVAANGSEGACAGDAVVPGAVMPEALAPEAVIPVVAESLQVGRRQVETGRVRLTKLVHEEEEVVDLPVLREEVHVERVPVGRFVDGPVEARQEGDTLVLPVLEEVLVVEKRLMLKEEIRVTRTRTEARSTQTVTLRNEEVRIDRPPPAGGAQGM
jgi:uncharacterized protein (TIGR02271 family)